MVRWLLMPLTLVTMVGTWLGCQSRGAPPSAPSVSRPVLGPETVSLPPPNTVGGMSVEEVIARRRSVREFTDEALTEEQISQLCWAAQGITGDNDRFRSAPSAGALYPLEVYVCSARGVYRYDPEGHRLTRHIVEDRREQIQVAALGQEAVGQAGCVFVVTGVETRTREKYEDRAARYVWLEAGHAAQNLLLEAVALDLGAVPIGAFDDEALAEAMELTAGERPLYLIPVGRPR